MTDQLVLTALDGALLDALKQGTAVCGQMREAISQLRSKGIPVILFTDCDRVEVEPIRGTLGLSDPFITECGSAIFTPVNHNPFEPVLGEKDGEYYVEDLGCPYVQARAGLRVIANEISHPLKGFGDFTVEQLTKFAKISGDDAHRAKSREFSEPFMTPKAVETDTLRAAIEGMGFGLVLRSADEGRFSYLISGGAGLELAVQRVISAYQTLLPEEKPLQVVGISHRADDLSMLADMTPSIALTRILLSQEEPVPDGWLSAVAPLLT